MRSLKKTSLVSVIAAADDIVRNSPIEDFCRGASAAELLEECAALDRFRQESPNLYERVRALLFVSAIHRYWLPAQYGPAITGRIPFEGWSHLLNRRYEEAIAVFRSAQDSAGPSETVSSALAAAYRGLAFQTLADQVRRSVRSVRGNQWMFRMGHTADYPLRIRRELLQRDEGMFPVLAEATPVRMDLSHSGWSDIFFLGMDFPEGARVLNVSIDLSVRDGSGSQPKPPVEAFLRVIDRPVLRLASVDLAAQADISSLAEIFDFARDYLGLLKAAIIASGLVPPGLEGSGHSLTDLLERLTGRPGLGIEIVSKVNDIPKGSRLAVSTNLLACLITTCMRATGQITALTGTLDENERRLVAARAILGEWLGGSGGGWQDSGGVWPGIKLIEGVQAAPGDVEYGISRGCLLPGHRIIGKDEVPEETRTRLQNSLVLVHGGMAQDVGPILEMVTEKYLLRSGAEWQGRQEAMALLDEIIAALHRGDVPALGAATQRNFDGPIQTIISQAGNHYTDQLIRAVRTEFNTGFYGFWMLGGMSGGGMGFMFDPAVKESAQDKVGEIMSRIKRRLEHAVPFAMEPVVYDFAINEHGTTGRIHRGLDALLPAPYYTLVIPDLLRRDIRQLSTGQRTELERFGAACQTQPALAGMASTLIEHLLPHDAGNGVGQASGLDTLLEEYGFDRVQHEAIRADLRAGRIGLAQNALPAVSRITDVRPQDYADLRAGVSQNQLRLGTDLIRSGAVAVVSMAGGVGSRWTRGAGVVKAINPLCRMDGEYRTFVEVHLAKTRRASRQFGAPIPHVFTTSYLTHGPIEAHLHEVNNYAFEGPLYLSPGRSIGLRMIPMTRDLRFLWEQTPQQVLDEQKQKVRESLRAGLIAWAEHSGEASDYRDNVPQQCLHPVGHWYEVPNMLRNGVLHRLVSEHPQLKYLLLHNIDTLGATVDPGCLGVHAASGAAMSVEVIPRTVDDHGGGLALVDGRPRLIEGLALPSEELEFEMAFYNSGTMWIDIDKLLEVFGLTRAELGPGDKVAAGVRAVAARMPTYITLKDVKKRWGKGQEDVFPVVQFEKLWGDMTTLPELDSRFLAVARLRGQQLKDVAQLDGWMRDGSAGHVRGLCDWS
jgi:galactokinase/mevalonate kinase-like predicted kinase